MESIDRTIKMRFCVECNTEFCYPFEWEEDGPEHWDVLLVCGNCEHEHRGRYHQLEVEDFDCWLDDTQDEVRREYERLLKLNMYDETERFKRMLELDVILPADFGEPSGR